MLQKLNSSDLHKKISADPKREIEIKRITVIDEAVFFSYLIWLHYSKYIKQDHIWTQKAIICNFKRFPQKWIQYQI